MIGDETITREGFGVTKISRLESDSRLLPTHISILTAILICWQHNQCREPFSVRRRKLMVISNVDIWQFKYLHISWVSLEFRL